MSWLHSAFQLTGSVSAVYFNGQSSSAVNEGLA